MVAHSRAPLRVDRLRALNTPKPAQVAVDDRGNPVSVDGTGVEEVLETWRIDDEWWREPIVRRYADVVLAGGRHVVLFEDLRTRAWFAQMP
jgi:hypothetical protein